MQMNTSYDELKVIMDNQYEVRERTGRPTSNFHDLIIDLLSRNGIQTRQEDGANPVVTFSIPQTEPDSFVIGLRYTKLDGTKTEDHFLFRKDNPIEYLRGKRLEKLMPEYNGAHKYQR